MKRTYSTQTQKILLMAALGVFFVLTACQSPSPTPPGKIDIQTINTATPVERLVRTEDIPVENCAGTGSAHRTIARTKVLNNSISIGSTAQIEGGGEVEIPETIKAELKAAISTSQENKIFEGIELSDEIEVEVAPESYVIYTIQWVEESYSSTVKYMGSDGKVYTAPYVYKIQVPKQSGSHREPCPTPSLETNTSSASPMVAPESSPKPVSNSLGGGSGKLIFSAWKNSSQYNVQIYLLNLGTGLDTIDTDHLVNLSNNLTIDKDPSWAPDGSQILFVSYRDENYDIYLMDANGQNPVNLTRHPDRDYQPVWSPDGYYIAFSSYRGPGTNQDVFIMKSNGTDVRQISTTGRYYQDPAWSPDSQKVFFIGWDKDISKDKAEIFVYDISTHKMEKLTNLGKLSTSPDVSPDGKTLVFISTYAGFKNLFLIGTDGYNLQQLTQQTQTEYLDPAWSPDGKWIAFVAKGDAENTLYLFNVATRKKFAILSLPGLRYPAWSP